MQIKCIIELSMVLDTEKFHKILVKVSDRSDYMEENGEKEYIDRSLVHKGMTILYRDSQYKKKVRILVDLGVAPKDDHDMEHSIRKLNKQITEYFGFKYGLNDFAISGIVFSADIDVGTHENVVAYLKVLHRIGRVKGFSPSGYDCFEEGESFCLDGNSNAVEFLLYDLESVIVDQLRNTGTDYKKLKLMARESEGILRAEVRLAKPKAVKEYTNVADILKQIAVLLKNSQDIFLDVFMKIIPFGDFYKKDKATEIVQKEVEDAVLRRKMLRMLELVPEKKSLYLAQKTMNCRNIEKVMEAFAKINVSPITISKRQDTRKLICLYSVLFNEK